MPDYDDLERPLTAGRQATDYDWNFIQPQRVQSPTSYDSARYNPAPRNSLATVFGSFTTGAIKVPRDCVTLDIDDHEKPTGEQSDDSSSLDKPQASEASSEIPPVAFRQLFRYADGRDKWLMGIGAIAAFVVGASRPAMCLLFGRILNQINQSDAAMIRSQVSLLALYMTVVGLGSWALEAMGMAVFSVAGDRQTRRLRCEVFHAILSQEVAFFDTHKAGQLTNLMSSDIKIIARLLSSKIFLLIAYLSTFFLSFVFAFTQSWALTLVMMGIAPMIGITSGILAKVLSTATAKAQEIYAQAGTTAEEVLSAVRTVHAFDGIDRECQRYEAKVTEVQTYGIRKGLYAGVSEGVNMFIIFASYAIAFYYGSYLVEWKLNTPGDVIGVFWIILVGAMQVGLVGPIFTCIAEARGAASKMYNVLDRQPAMEVNRDGLGTKLPELRGNVEFRGVAFTYPARPDIPIFKDFDLTIQPGQRVALVGPSGSGKSSIIALIERFYDPDAGQVLVDGVPLAELNLHWWRSQVGIVTQEPTLFQATVLENILCANPEATEEDVIQACKDAFIHDVISKLPDGYNTMVGESGSQLSGGQKQRVAIARAIVKNPKILLLDEATSALDRDSEMIVQEALNNVMRNRTVVTIAHRLVTIQDSNVICYIQPRDPHAAPSSAASASRMVECGTHEELMKLQGEYSKMVVSQSQISERQLGPATQYAGAAAGKDAPEAGAPETRITELAEAARQRRRYATLRRTAKLSAPDNWFIAFGVLAAAALGTSYPLYAIVFSGLVNVLYQPNMRQEVWKWCLLFIALGTLNLVGYLVKDYCLTNAGEKLTCRLRGRLFRAMLTQDVGFFDLPGHESGALCNRLASDTTEIQCLWGSALGSHVQAFVSMAAGIIVAFTVSWELALVVSCTIPMMAGARCLETKFMYSLVEQGGRGEQRAGQVASESITGHRTVFAFNLQAQQQERYAALQNASSHSAVKKGVIAGFFYGFSQFCIFASFALAFYYSGVMIAAGRLAYADMLKCSFALLMGAMGVGEVYSVAGDSASAKAAARRTYALLDRVPPIDTVGDGGAQLAAVAGNGSFQDVHFSYPARPTVSVLRGLNLAFQEGQRVAIMGATGCGKSTIISLLMRYYDPREGNVHADDQNLRDVNLRSWRNHVGIVSQEPVLFDDTVANNIKYGKPGATDEEMFEAARQANIHDVIRSLPLGYETNVGPRGSQLSGGQKQRVAIARCILRHPAVLLLDEATSALDNVSEREVQAALDQIVLSRKMTVLTVAHRLSTIRNCTLIVILDQGRVLEMGTHEELFALGGEYTRRYSQYYGIKDA